MFLVLGKLMNMMKKNNIIGKLFSKDEENLQINTTLAISKCHSFLR